MAHASATIEIPASADEVWQLIGGFDTLPDWLPFIPDSRLSEGGRVRHLETEAGDEIVERLEAFDNQARSYSYSFLQAPFPVRDYLATLRVSEAGGGKRAQVEWSGTFAPVGVSEEEATQLFTDIYQTGLQALAAKYPAA